ncbi:hypothetical protein NM688_g4920 [Phlebia brevispora]|uniref:Uncharacterized protein n=1 Tax=Phlebia brevispora TaxID=194682 RepID=A0ACC1T1L5_9APHY|nr:hypothetical protein NM688_g4920 [Phlebia brevispora]
MTSFKDGDPPADIPLAVLDAGNEHHASQAVAEFQAQDSQPHEITTQEREHNEAFKLDRHGLWSLGAQHLSSTWGDRTAEFAFYLYLIQLFQTTLLPASLYGFFTTGIAILFSGPIGSLVDRVPKLQFVRWCILFQKLSASGAYACFLVLFATSLQDRAATGLHAPFLVWLLFALIVLCGCALKLSTVGISVAIERDWVTCIAEGHDEALTTMNTILRRIDLLCKLLAPLFASLLTTAASYTFSVAFFLAFGVVTLIFEIFWIQVVYRRLPAIASEENEIRAARANRQAERSPSPTQPAWSVSLLRGRAQKWIHQEMIDWSDFVKHPIFGSSFSISCLYLTVLSFDGTMLSWLKTHAFSDPFIAGMRAICVVAGLFGTFIAPFMEKRIGLIRAGNWAIWSELFCLIPVLVSFYVDPPRDGMRSIGWNSALLFTGMALSRIGLWAFDLCQLKELQTALVDHPRRNAITGLQFSMQNIADLLKYVLTIILSRPSQFRWAALVSFISVGIGAISYLTFLKRMRGHIIHKEWTDTLLLLAKGRTRE